MKDKLIKWQTYKMGLPWDIFFVYERMKIDNSVHFRRKVRGEKLLESICLKCDKFL